MALVSNVGHMKNIYTFIMSLFLCLSVQAMEDAPSTAQLLPLDIQKYLLTFLPESGLPALKVLLTPFSQTNKYNRILAQELYALKKENLLKIISAFDQANYPLKHRQIDLLKNGINDCYDGCALHAAILADKPELVSLLLKNNPNLELKTHWNQTPLFLAIEKQQWRSACLLLDRGANPNSCDGSEMPALHVALYKRNPDIVDLLLKKGADVNAFNQGRTALYKAIEDELYDMIKVLLAHGADVNIGSKLWSALDFAQRKGNQEIIHMLMTAENFKQRAEWIMKMSSRRDH